VNDQLHNPDGLPRLTVPSPLPGGATHPEMLTDPAELHSAVETLLLSDASAATVWFARQLALTNRTVLSATVRRGLITAVQPVLATLGGLAVRVSTDLGPATLLQQKGLYDGLAELATEYAYALKLLLLQQYGHAVQPLVDAGVLIETLRALEFEALLALAVYRQVPRRTWQEAMEIRRLALQAGCADQTVQLPDARGQTTSQTVTDSYQRFLLLLLLDPHRLPRGGLWLAQRYLESRAGACSFMDYTEESAGEFFISVDLDGAAPRAAGPRQTGNEAPAGYRHLRLTNLFARVRDEFALIEHGGAPADCTECPRVLLGQVLRAMLVAWYLRPPRQAEREPVGGWMSAVVGFDDTALVLRSAAADEADSAEYGRAPPPSVVRCVQVDQSANGVGMEFHGVWPASLQVGQLLLLQRKDSDLMVTAERFIAVVRRLLLRPGQVLAAGLQRIPGRPVSVVVDRQDQRDKPFGALLLRRSGGNRLGLIVPPGTFASKLEFAIREPGGDFVACADKLLETNEFFERIEISPVERAERAPRQGRRAGQPDRSGWPYAG
jgi:hypothetical protein